MTDLNIFRAYDIRGIFGDALTVETMLNLGRAFGTYLINKNLNYITIGADIRASSSILMKAFISGVSSTGVSCDAVNRSPLGITLFNSFINKYAASAFITASHLPPEWNGIKFYWGKGIGFSPAENEEIKQIYLKNKFTQVDAFNIGKITDVDPFENYVKYLKDKLEIDRSYNIAIDCGNGATSLVVPELFERLGFNVKSIFDEPDPRFPNRSSEPNEKSLSQLSDFVKNNNFDFAAGFDGDGDRCVFVDELGNVLPSDTFGLIVADYLLNNNDKKNIIINMECTIAMETYLKELGANVNRIRVGHSFLSLESDKTDAIWGVEASGHAIAPDIFLFDDALILPLLFAKSLSYHNKKVSELSNRFPLPIKHRFDLKCDDSTKFSKLAMINDFLRSEEGEINDTDGTALTNDFGRILVRVSNTSPKIRITIESISQEGFDKLKSMYLDKITNLINEN